MSDLDPRAQEVLDLWFPDTGQETSLETHGAFWNERMRDGMDATIIERYGELTLAAATGQLDAWAEMPRGRLALLIVLDQFPRSLWRDTPAAFAQDIKAARLALEGVSNGHYETLAPWEQAFFVISITHCEGPDHLSRLALTDDLVTRINARMPEALAPMRGQFLGQQVRIREILKRFGRHPHRNPILSRPSSPAEEAYIAA